MVDSKTEKIIHALLDELKKKYSDFRGIYLFGSRARGDFYEDSDYDFAVIFEKKPDWLLKREISNIIALIMTQFSVIIDNPVFSIDDIVEPKTPLRETIKKEGIFYEAA